MPFVPAWLSFGTLDRFARYELPEMQLSDGEGMARYLRASPDHSIGLAARQAGLYPIEDATGFGARHSAESLGTRVSRRVYL